MSLGHMTKEEQAITLLGMFVLTPGLAFLGQYVLGSFGLGVGTLAGIALTFVGKAWTWKYTSYRHGLTNPSLERGGADED